MNRLVLVLAVIASAAPALAQERSAIGLGVAIAPLEAADVPPNTPTVEVYVPLRVGAALRVEPSLGIRTANRPAGTVGPNQVEDERDVTIGVGVFALSRVAAPVDLYAGGRLKLDFAKVTLGDGTSDTGTDVLIAGAVGAEDYLSPRFSIGLEGELGYYSLSSVSRGGEASGVFTTGLAFLRVYF